MNHKGIIGHRRTAPYTHLPGFVCCFNKGNTVHNT